jgi:hypothetical protein
VAKNYSVRPAKDEQLESFQVTPNVLPDVMVIDPGQQLNSLGARPIVCGVIKGQHFLTFFAGQNINDTNNDNRQGQHKFTPVMFGIFQEVISCILAKSKIRVLCNFPGKVDTFKGQRENHAKQNQKAKLFLP